MLIRCACDNSCSLPRASRSFIRCNSAASTFSASSCSAWNFLSSYWSNSKLITGISLPSCFSALIWWTAGATSFQSGLSTIDGFAGLACFSRIYLSSSSLGCSAFTLRSLYLIMFAYRWVFISMLLDYFIFQNQLFRIN